MGINLLQDREQGNENGQKKKASVNFDLTNPKEEKDLVKPRLKKGGIMEFFKNIFHASPKIKIQKQEEIIKEAPDVFKKKRPRRKRPQVPPAPQEIFSPPLDPARGVKEKQLAAVGKQTVPQQNVPQKDILKKPMITPPLPEVKKEDLLNGEEITAGAPLADQEQAVDVNLIPEEIRIKLEPKRKLKTLIAAVVICAAVVLAIWGAMIWQQNKIQQDIKEVIAETGTVQQGIAGYESTKATGQKLAATISQAQAVLDSHVYWTKFLAELENYTLPEVTYQNMAADLAGKVNLSVQAADLATLAKQYVVFQNAEDFVESVEITAVALGAGEESRGITFSISLSVNPSVFYTSENKQK